VRARNRVTEQNVEKTIRDLRAREASLVKENEEAESYIRQVLEESRSERVEADKPKFRGAPTTGSSSAMDTLLQPTGAPKSFGPSAPLLPKLSVFSGGTDPWKSAIDAGKGIALPKAASQPSGAWGNYKPSQENGSSGTHTLVALRH
jgi:hypothetical protein